MNITQAIEILEQYKDAQGFPYMLEALQHIDDTYFELDPTLQCAFNVFVDLGQKFFSSEEEV